MKHFVLILASAAVLAACGTMGGTDSTTINQVRGKNGALLTDAEMRQQNRQRESELTESAAKTAKIRMAADSAREGVSAVREGINVLRELRSVFGR
ncbi:NGK_0946 family protein [Neisseria animalis]|uniref:Lipoprotein n=1 Tax=Neisseria animalis TaxID=492 RepID=A0A5P3MSB8_NEIAN|nr:hypothetical protein [Neisseria animalis]QEY24506.1 hypothetical protein D0T90_08515 [Neisseria animalis]ROW33075.1 hypothetical protein CGZ60_02195 [Neisseria animalis]VEE07218.1 Uncharacterised protein [Neisseria animalis]